MARFFVPLDVNYQLDDKIMSAGPLAECIYVRALAYSKRATTEGRIARAHLRFLGVGIRNANRHAEILVECGLWQPTPSGWYIVGWLNHNMSNGALTEEKARKRALSVAGNHKRHHVAKGIIDDECELCVPPVREPEVLPESSRAGTKTPPISVAREDEEEEKRRRREEKRRESSSSSSEFKSDPPTPEDEEDQDLISAAMKFVAERVTRQRDPGDPFAYKQTVLTDQTRIADIRQLHGHHPDFNAEQLAALHGGRELARVIAMTEPELPEPPWPPVSTYTPPPPVEPEIVPCCEGCDKPAALMRIVGCKNPDPPAGCVATVATVHHIRPETA